MTQVLARAAVAALCVLSLSGCVDSKGPILAGSKPVLGQSLRFQLYTLHKGFAEQPEQAKFKWDGARYAYVEGGMSDVAAFSVHPFEAGDFIIQSVPVKRPHIAEYAVLHIFADGVYHVVAIDEDDADAATRAAHCSKGDNKDPSSCRITTRKQLFALARATVAKSADKRGDNGVLAVRIPERAP